MTRIAARQVAKVPVRPDRTLQPEYRLWTRPARTRRLLLQALEDRAAPDTLRDLVLVGAIGGPVAAMMLAIGDLPAAPLPPATHNSSATTRPEIPDTGLLNPLPITTALSEDAERSPCKADFNCTRNSAAVWREHLAAAPIHRPESPSNRLPVERKWPGAIAGVRCVAEEPAPSRAGSASPAPLIPANSSDSADASILPETANDPSQLAQPTGVGTATMSPRPVSEALRIE